MDARKYLAELIGTFILVVVGSLSIFAATTVEAASLVVRPMRLGLGSSSAKMLSPWLETMPDP